MKRMERLRELFWQQFNAQQEIDKILADPNYDDRCECGGYRNHRDFCVKKRVTYPASKEKVLPIEAKPEESGAERCACGGRKRHKKSCPNRPDAPQQATEEPQNDPEKGDEPKPDEEVAEGESYIPTYRCISCYELLQSREPFKTLVCLNKDCDRSKLVLLSSKNV